MRKLIAAILSVSTFITAYANLEVHMLATPVTLVGNGSYVEHTTDFNLDGIDDFKFSLNGNYCAFSGINNQKFQAEYLNFGGIERGLAYLCGAQMNAGGYAQTSVELSYYFDGKGPRYLNLLRFEGNYNGYDHWRYGWAKLEVAYVNNARQIIFYGWALETTTDVEVLAGQGECIGTGISNVNYNKPGIYTAGNKIFVEHNDEAILRIYDLTGKKVYDAAALSENDFSFLPSGVYCAVLTGRSKTESLKIYR